MTKLFLFKIKVFFFKFAHVPRLILDTTKLCQKRAASLINITHLNFYDLSKLNWIIAKYKTRYKSLDSSMIKIWLKISTRFEKKNNSIHSFA